MARAKAAASDAALFAAMDRRRYISLVLQLAIRDEATAPTPGGLGWDQLVRVACQMGGSRGLHPADFAPLRDLPCSRVNLWIATGRVK